MATSPGCAGTALRSSAYTSSAWFHRYAVHAETKLFPKGRTKFIRPDGSVGWSPGHGVVLLGVGEVANDALRNSGLGFVVGAGGARKAERQWYHHGLHLPGLDDALMADSKSCDEVHPAGTHMGRCPWLTVHFPRPAYKPTFHEASRHSPAFSRKKACRA
jgi:hypothetical protein